MYRSDCCVQIAGTFVSPAGLRLTSMVFASICEMCQNEEQEMISYCKFGEMGLRLVPNLLHTISLL